MASCNKNDDDGPSTPTVPGVFKGTLMNPQDGSTSEWVATSTKAEHDTISGELRIRAQNAAGDVIMILLKSAEPAYYTLFQNTTDESTYQSSTLASLATTRTNDVPVGNKPAKSTVEITDNGETDGRIKGNIISIQWYVVGDGIAIADDAKFAMFSEGEFDIAVTRGTDMGGSGNPEISALIDGSPFNPTSAFPSGLTLSATDFTHSISITLPSNATIGSHDFGSSFDGYNVSFSAGMSFYDMEGTIYVGTFNSIEGTATGTFEGTATPWDGDGDSISITNGTFRF